MGVTGASDRERRHVAAMIDLAKIDIARVHITIRLTQPARLPKFLGSTLRGAFGHVFRRCVCSARRKTCDCCLLAASCPYLYVFETPVSEEARMMRLYTHAPHPFVIEPPETYSPEMAAGTRLTFSLVLIGRGCDYLPYFALTFQELGKTGIGPWRAAFELETVTDASPGGGSVLFEDTWGKLTPPRRFAPALPEDEESYSGAIAVSFRSPTRLKFNGKLVSEIPFHVLVRSLLRRLSALSAFHGAGPLNLDFAGLVERARRMAGPLNLDFAGLVERARRIEAVASSLKWVEHERFSGRQKKRMALGGITGEVSYVGDMGEFLPFLRLGRWVHVGKATSFGFGRYEFEKRPTA